MSVAVAILIGAIIAIAATIYACIAIVPEKKRAGLKGSFLVFVHDLCNFKALLLEKILKVLYIFCTCMCIAGGFFMLFARIKFWGYSQSMALYGVAMLILGPIVMRILFESAMLVILGVKNIIQINQKLGSGAAPAAPKAPAAKAPAAPAPAPAPAPAAPVAPAAPAAPVYAQPAPAPAAPVAPAAPAPAPAPAPAVEPRYVFCTECGTRYDANAGGCPNGCTPGF